MSPLGVGVITELKTVFPEPSSYQLLDILSSLHLIPAAQST